MARWGTLQSDRVRAALYYSRKRRLARIAANAAPAPYDGPRDDDFSDVVYLANFSGIEGFEEQDSPSVRTFQAQVGAGESVLASGVHITDGIFKNTAGSRCNLLSPSDEPLLNIGTNSFCAEAFVRMYPSPTNFKWLLAQYDGTPEKSWLFQPDSGFYRVSLSANGSTSTYVSTGISIADISTVNFDHLAIIYDTGVFGVYINGVRRFERSYSSLNATLSAFSTQINGEFTAIRYTARNNRYGDPDTLASFTPPTPYLGGFPEYGPLEE